MAVFCRNKKVGIKKHEIGNGTIKLYFKDLVIYNCYISPNSGELAFESYIDTLMQDVRNEALDKVILGDLNAKSPLWGAARADARGEYIADWMGTNDLVVSNVGNTPTFVRGSSNSIIDITLSSPGAARRITNWVVLEEETFSLHKNINFNIKYNREVARMEAKCATTFDKAIFGTTLSMLVKSTEENSAVIIDCIKRAQQSSASFRFANKNQPYWWNDRIEVMRGSCNSWRRKLTRIRSSKKSTESQVATAEKEYKLCRNEYKKEIRVSKSRHWKTVLDELERDLWGQGFQIVMKQLRGTNILYNIDEETKMRIASDMFPQKEDHVGRSKPCNIENPFTYEELAVATGKLKSGKAPGPDGIKTEVLKEAFRVIPTAILGMFNKLLNRQEFPAQWKKASLVLIPKTSPTVTPQKYRTICLLDSMGKLLEQLLKDRLEKELERTSALSDRQFGFRKNRSTTDAVNWVTTKLADKNVIWSAVITVDVENAFNTATWSIIIERLNTLGISTYLVNYIESYFADRKLNIARHSLQLTQGVPQGSVLGPTLWNILYNSVLDLELPENCQTVAYADDLALIVKANDSKTLIDNSNTSLEAINNWMKENSLKLAPAKTEALLVRGSRRKADICFTLDGINIRPCRTLKYLGVWLDSELRYGEHITQAVTKAERLVTALTRITPNISGLGSQKRTILYGVVQSTLLYGAPVWRRAMDIKKYREQYKQLQRRMLLRVASAYKTTSAEALCTITGVLPIDLAVKERALLYDLRKNGGDRTPAEVRDEVMQEWQRRWEANTEKAQWTKLLIPEIAPWEGCNFRCLNYAFTQFLTEHGCFKSYTYRIGKSEDDRCVYCGKLDNAAHAVLHCEKWQHARRSTENETGVRLTTDNIIQEMLKSAKRWNIISAYICKVINEKERDERERIRLGLQR